MANEKRLDLIDRSALGIGICNPLVFDKIEYAHGWNCAIEIIQNAPTVDAVEVVRCKDCKHRADALDCGNYLCNRKMIGMVRPNDFCSFGEREDNDV